MNPSIAIKTTNLVFYSPTISPPHVGWYKQLKLLKGAPHHHTDPPLQTVGPFIKTWDTFLLQVEVEQMSELCPPPPSSTSVCTSCNSLCDTLDAKTSSCDAMMMFLKRQIKLILW